MITQTKITNETRITTKTTQITFTDDDIVEVHSGLVCYKLCSLVASSAKEIHLVSAHLIPMVFHNWNPQASKTFGQCS